MLDRLCPYVRTSNINLCSFLLSDVWDIAQGRLWQRLNRLPYLQVRITTESGLLSVEYGNRLKIVSNDLGRSVFFILCFIHCFLLTMIAVIWCSLS